MVAAERRNGGTSGARAQGVCGAPLSRGTPREPLEKRRPRTFGGIGAHLDRMLTLSDVATCDTELDKSLLTGVMAGAIWTADRAHRRGLRPDSDCPYCPQEVREDEDHLLC